MGKLKYLVVHCTATPEGREVTRADIERWHLKERGWSQVGYSDLIHIDGTLENLVDWDQDQIIEASEITNGAKGYNGIARHVVYAGGSSPVKPSWASTYPPKDTRTKLQYRTLETYVNFHVLRYPDIKIIGHNEISNKSCPSFDVGKFCRDIGVPEKNIGI